MYEGFGYAHNTYHGPTRHLRAPLNAITGSPVSHLQIYLLSIVAVYILLRLSNFSNFTSILQVVFGITEHFQMGAMNEAEALVDVFLFNGLNLRVVNIYS